MKNIDPSLEKTLDSMIRDRLYLMEKQRLDKIAARRQKQLQKPQPTITPVTIDENINDRGPMMVMMMFFAIFFASPMIPPNLNEMAGLLLVIFGIIGIIYLCYKRHCFLIVPATWFITYISISGDFGRFRHNFLSGCYTFTAFILVGMYVIFTTPKKTDTEAIIVNLFTLIIGGLFLLCLFAVTLLSTLDMTGK